MQCDEEPCEPCEGHGCKQHVVQMVMGLIGSEHGFGIEDEIRERLSGETLRKAETDAYIVDRVVSAIDVLKQCSTEQSRQQYHIILGAASSVRVEQRGNE